MKKITTIFMMLCIVDLNAQVAEIDYKINGQFANGFVWAHNKKLQNLGGSRVNGFTLELLKNRTDDKAKGYWENSFATGYQFSFFTLGSDILGKAYNLSYFLEPNIIKTNFFNASIRLTSGINLATNPYHEEKNNQNLAYSSPLNAFLALGLACNFKVTKSSAVSSLFSYNHISNGGLYHPNFGVNFPTWQIGYMHHIASVKKNINENFQTEKWRYDFFVFGTNKSTPVYKNIRNMVYGSGISASRRIFKFSAINFTVEYMNDLNNKKIFKADSVYNKSTARIGTLVGHEFIFNKMIFSQQFGYYVFNQTYFLNNFYHRWGLMYKINKNFMIGTNLNADAQKAQFLELRLQYSFYK